jgi:hypothetical protein
MSILNKEYVDSVVAQILDADAAFVIVGMDRSFSEELEQYGLNAYCYTVGLSKYGKPELIVTGPQVNSIAYTLKLIAAYAHERKAFDHDWIDTDCVFGGVPIQIKTLLPHQCAPLVQVAAAFCSTKHIWPTFQQIVIADRASHLPHEENYETEYMTNRYGQILLYEDHLIRGNAHASPIS